MTDFEDKMEIVHENVSIFDAFDLSGLPIKYDSRTIPSQIACPFHGVDLHKSARVYPSSNSFHCWFCDKSWDVIAFWAQANEWWKEDGRLDYARGLYDLMLRFNLRTTLPDWKVKLNKSVAKIRQRGRGYEAAPMEERLRLKSFYASRVAKVARMLPVEERQSKWPLVQSMWDELDGIDLEGDSWKNRLADWTQHSRGLLTIDEPDGS